MKDRRRPAVSSPCKGSETQRRAERSASKATSRSEAPGAASLRRVVTHPATISALLAIALYLSSLGFGFVRDDHALIERNPFLQHPGWLGKLMVSDFWSPSGGSSGLWRPLITLSYQWDNRIGGGSPTWFHAVNVLGHAATSAALAALLLALGLPRLPTLMAGAWFAAMPAHVESVAWISGRTDVFCGLFFILALWLDRRARHSGKRWPGLPALIALILALASKEAAVTFVAVVAVAEASGREGRPPRVRESVRWLVPYGLITAAYLILHTRWSSAPLLPAAIDAMTQARRRWAAWTMVPGYIGFLWPWDPHSPERELLLPPSPTSPTVLLGIGLEIGLLVALAVLIRRRSRTATPLALFWFPLLVPMAVTFLQASIAYAERLLYLSSAGAAWMLGLLVASASAWPPSAPSGRARSWRWAVLALGALVIVVSAAETIRILPPWRDDAGMFREMTRVQPGNAKAHVGWAEALESQGHEQEALGELQIAERLDPKLPEVHVSRAAIFFRHGDWPRVLSSADRALALDSLVFEARLLKATALLRMRRLGEADALLERMLAERPMDPAIQAIRGQLLLVEGRFAEALSVLEAAAQWIRDDASLAYALGMAGLKLERLPEARAGFERTVAIDPRFYDGWLRLALTCHLLGDTAARERALQRAASLPEARDGRVERLRRQFATP